jgi:hypothetical protein
MNATLITVADGGDLRITTSVHENVPFREIWCADFEFRADPGERPWPVCMVAREFYSGREIRLWREDLLAMVRPLQYQPELCVRGVLR